MWNQNMPNNLPSIRITPRDSEFLNRKLGSKGEIFYDQTDDTLRLYDGKATGGYALLRADLSNLKSSGLNSNINLGTGSLTAASIVGELTGNASTATKWHTARTLTLSGNLSGSVTIDGSSNITLEATIVNNAVILGQETTGNYVAVGSVSGNGLSGSANSESATFTVSSNATDVNTPSTIVFRNSSGNFSAGTITASLSGNVTGNVTGTVITASQPNITTVGTLTSLTVTSDVTANANVVIATNPTITTHATNKKYVDKRSIAMSVALS